MSVLARTYSRAVLAENNPGMFLKNYTSAVPSHVTIYRIEQTLIKCGVSGIAKEYAPSPSGTISAITFKISIPEFPVMNVRLPVDEEKALQALWMDYVGTDKLSPDGKRIVYNSYKKKCRDDFSKQASMTAWKIVQDWVEVQMSMIQMKQADFMQVFLPYIWNGRTTYYEALKENKFRALLPESSS